MTAITFITFATAFAATYVGVAIFPRLAVRIGLVSLPNERSSHKVSTPHGSGVIFVVIYLFLYLCCSRAIGSDIQWGFVISAALIAVISLLDDIFSISFILRFIVQTVAALIFVFTVGIGPFGNERISIGEQIMAVIWIVGLVNVFNFMDGIDGLAGTQGFLAGAGWLVFGIVFDQDMISLMGGTITFSMIGFLLHNWHPARVFMGDVGSAFLGFVFATIPLMAKPTPQGRYVVPMLAVSFVWFFVFDMTFTSISRTVRGQKVWIPAREHIYQKLIIKGRSHSSVSILYGMMSAAVIAAALVSALLGGMWVVLDISLIVAFTATLVVLAGKNILT